MPRTDTILVVDDDPALRELLSAYLGDNGFQVELAADGAGMRRAMDGTVPDAVVLDLMLPGEDGLALTREIRARSTVPILMLSARGEEIDRVVGLEVGADDYLAKPFSPREMLARLRALLRRSQAMPVRDDATVSRFGPFLFDPAARRLLRDGVDLDLSAAEFDLLKAFVERPNRVLNRDFLLELLKGYERDPFDRTVDIRVGRLRRKIEADPAHPAYIRTVRGEGYLFNPRGNEAEAPACGRASACSSKTRCA
jgi:DNA-binding response OmpR family regulator